MIAWRRQDRRCSRGSKRKGRRTYAREMEILHRQGNGSLKSDEEMPKMDGIGLLGVLHG